MELTLQFERRFERGPTIRPDLRLAFAPPGSLIAVLFGRSGCGKTTVLRALAGLDRPDHGTIRCDGETWFDAGCAVAPQTRRVGFIAQHDALFPHLSVEGNIAYGLASVPRAERGRRIHECMEAVGVAPLARRRPDQLSGGQRQRVSIARAIAPRPRLLLLDEPFTALDVPARQAVRSELRSLLGRLGIPTILVTHDRSDVLALADYVAVMHDGRVLQSGSVSEVFGRPADPEVAAIVGVETVIEGEVASISADLLSPVRVGAATVVAFNPQRLIGRVLVCIRGEDVILRREDSGQESARNRLTATVTAITPEGPLARIGLDAGFPLSALVTRPSCEDLGIVPGARFTALIKAPSVHLISR